ncbi:hypothetical protein N0V84_002546 [Fusarium piperis]|uniref:FAD-binding FR-type domain-containing protein n=1 Tax=Fusarium piperis TaxID=1435070 RepID=A0A9W9BRL3_9HYPO|nr:hypothetical protein N0V84_002546 [Fusarium piperis]
MKQARPTLQGVSPPLRPPDPLRRPPSASASPSRTAPALPSVKQYSPIQALAVQESRELYTSPGRNCIHMELDLSDQAELRYRTGDHLAVYPTNPGHEVQFLLKALGLEQRAETPLLIQALEEGEPIKIPSPTSSLALFRHYLEVSAPVSRETVGALARFSPSPEVASRLTTLGKDKQASLAALVLSGPTPPSYVVETLPTTQPRCYSISSSSAVSARKIAITVGADNSPLQADPTKAIRGVTASYLYALGNSLSGDASQLEVGPGAPAMPSRILGHKVFAYIRRSNFKLPTLDTTPLVMIGAGTGMAPFRGFTLERARLKAVGKHIGRMILFFGCRSPDQDSLYREELASVAKELDGLLEIVPAFSRSNSHPKAYVEMKKDVCELLQSGANMYICGRMSMARAVSNVVEESMKQQNGWAESARKGSKWLEDVWG